MPSGAKLGAVNSIGGRTIVYNQLFTELSEAESNGVTATYVDNVITLNGTATQERINFSQMTNAMNVVAKFYIKMTMLKNDDKISFYYGWLSRSVGLEPIASGSTSAIYSQNEKELERGYSTGIAGFETGAVFNDVKIQIIIVNLTKMFGSGNEPSTVEEFEAMFPNDYYPYNEGELKSMGVNDVDVVGKNAFSKKNNLLCSKYPDTPWVNAYKGMDKAISQLSQSIQINDSSYSDVDSFKESLNGVYLYYELAEPIVTDISDIIEDTFQEPFKAESGGSLTFKNSNGDGYQVAVPSDIQYVVSLKEVA